MRRLLTWARLQDEDGVLSLTHVAVFVGLAVYAWHPDATTAGFATAMIGHYGYKKWLVARDASAEGEQQYKKITDTLSTLEGRLNSLTSGATWSASMKRGQ